ncbi:MAG: hypothetical protein P4L49_02760 [Desulfosporosinus sp.]|nr:hypothetical protein [Desulfosporosinus sp.]
MQKLTNVQILAVCNLTNHPMIDYSSVNSHTGGNINATVCSTKDANMAEILDELNIIFPVMTVEINPWVSESGNKLYNIQSDGEPIACLHMNFSKKEEAPAVTEAPEEIIHPEYNTEWPVLEEGEPLPLTGREVYLEFHESREDLGEVGGDF